MPAVAAGCTGFGRTQLSRHVAGKSVGLYPLTSAKVRGQPSPPLADGSCRRHVHCANQRLAGAHSPEVGRQATVTRLRSEVSILHWRTAAAGGTCSHQSTEWWRTTVTRESSAHTQYLLNVTHARPKVTHAPRHCRLSTPSNVLCG